MNQTGIRAGVRRLFRLPLHTAEIARDDADAELQSFLDERIEYLVLRGMTLEQARAEALRRMGNPLDETRAHLRRSAERRERKLQFRDTLDGVLQDVRFAARGLARRPGFTAIAVLTIAIGIGATTSVYSIVDRVLLRPLPWREPQRIVQVRQTYLKWRGNPQYQRSWNTVPLAMDEFETLRDRTTVFDGVGIWDNRGLILTGRGEAQQVRTTLTSASLLNVLGVHPIRGRGFLPGEDALGGPNIALLGYDAWQRRFGGADDAVGQFVKLDTISYQIVGILPPRLRVEQGASASEFWILAGHEVSDRQTESRSFDAVARLRPGITIQRAQAETDAILAGSSYAGPKGARLVDWHTEQTRNSQTPLLILLGAAGLLQLISCVNVAILLLGEATSRSQEMAARVALGAGRLRLARQLLTESVALAVAGGALGMLVAWWGTRVLIAIAPTNIPGLKDVHVDLRVLGVSAGATLVTGMLFGLAPALSLSRSAPATLLRSGAGQSIAGRSRLQRTLIAAEIALTFVLLVGSGLLSRSLAKLTVVDPGFRADDLLAVDFTLPPLTYRDSIAVGQFYGRAVDRLAHVPGVAAASASDGIPFSGGMSFTAVEIEGHPLAPGERGPSTLQRRVLPAYFHTMGIPLVAGRSFTDDDRRESEPVVVVSQAMARRDWPGESPIGRHVRYRRKWRTVVGVVADIKNGKLAADAGPAIYMPFQQAVGRGGLALVIRTNVPPATAAPAIRAALLEIDRNLPILAIDEIGGMVRRSFAEERFRTILISLFGVLAAALSAVGMYGVTSRAVARRNREVGIRMALGATEASVVRLIVRSTLSSMAIGIAAGLLIALVVARWATPLLYGVNARDPLTYTAILGFLALVGIVASWLPARRASRVHPAEVLRGE